MTCVVSRDLNRYEAARDRESAMESWIEAGRPDSIHEGDVEAMKRECRRCPLQVCRMRRSHYGDFLFNLGADLARGFK